MFVTRGQLRLYLGAAPGVGKTFAMLQEARRYKGQGDDVVVGFVETHGRSQTADLLEDLEAVPPREVLYRGVVMREMDTDAVIARRPRVALVDELAHTNVPGSRHEKRYEDLQDLLDAGIDVWSTLNAQHLESLNDEVERITGVAVRETVPDRVLAEASRVELIDMAPEALIQRMQQGTIYAPEQAGQALAHFFTRDNLTALRRLALRALADGLEGQRTHNQEDQAEAPAVAYKRIVVAVDHRPIGKTLIRHGRRIAALFKADLSVVYVEPPHGAHATQTLADERRLQVHLQLAGELGGQVMRLRGTVADELVAFARARKATLLVIGQSTRGRRDELLHGSVTHDLLRKARGIDVLVVAEPGRAARPEKDE